MEGKVKPGDMIWVKNRGGLWWPAQVVDENLVSESNRPGKRSARKVLVRLYGTYTYSYVDSSKWRSEFDAILEQNKGSYREIFMKSLEQDVSRLRTSKSRKQKPKSKDNKEEKYQQPKKSATEKKPTANGKRTKVDQIQNESKKKLKNSGNKKTKDDDQNTNESGGNMKKRKLNDSSAEKISCSQSQELSARRIRVMQSLGLAAPTGSPFGKNGQIHCQV